MRGAEPGDVAAEMLRGELRGLRRRARGGRREYPNAAPGSRAPGRGAGGRRRQVWRNLDDAVIPDGRRRKDVERLSVPGNRIVLVTVPRA